MIDTKVFEIYSYTVKERKAFSYIDRYMASVDDALTEDADALDEVGYALAGLFLTFRASNHSGCPMTTCSNHVIFNPDSNHYKRLVLMTELTGVEFTNSQQYLRTARVAKISLFLPLRHRLLFRIAKSRFVRTLL